MIFIIWTALIFDNVSSEVLSEGDQKQYRSSRFSIGFHLLLPVAGLGLLIFGRKYIFEKILLQLDKQYLTVLCPNFIRREHIVKWACTRLPPTWSSHSTNTLSGGLKELWTDGSLLCTLINTAVPGACPNPHRHWKQSPIHGQALAYKYFGISPIITNEDFNRNLSLSLERKFIRYLNEVQQAINKISENMDKEKKISPRYIVRGMGLFSGEQNKKATFYIYLDENNDEDDKEGNIIIQIKGPFGTFGEAVTPKLINKNRKRVRNNTKQGRRSSILFIENLQSNINNLSWNFARTQAKKVNDDIEVEASLENDRIKVNYIPTHYGMYEINMVSNGELIKGCPFNVHIFINELDNNDDTTKANLDKQKKIKRVKNNTLLELPENDEAKRSEDRTDSTKSAFNFKEVVDEITKSGAVFKNILGHTPERESSNLEIVASSADGNEAELEDLDLTNVTNKISDSSKTDLKSSMDSDVKDEYYEDSGISEDVTEDLDSHKLSIKVPQELAITGNSLKITEDTLRDESSIMESKFDSINEESKDLQLETSSKLTEQNLPADNKDYYSNVGKQTFHYTNNAKINNASAAVFANKNLINDNEKLQLESTQTSFVFAPKYINTININKIKIPEMFTNSPVTNVLSQLDEKYFKNILNESNKNSSKFVNVGPQQTTQDYDIQKNKEINIEKCGIIPLNQSFKSDIRINNGSNTSDRQNTESTSPICFEHIASEVEYVPVSVAERRKIFAQNSLGSGVSWSSENSLFSENEKEISDRQYQRGDLGVLTISNRLNGSVNSSNETWSLCSTVSLPNLSLESDSAYIVSVKHKKEFWENLSSRSSSTVSTKSLSPKKIENAANELEKSRLIWRKPVETSEKNVQRSFLPEKIHNSADDILSLTNTACETVKYNSVDELDQSNFISIQERKQKLLKELYQQEHLTQERFRKKITSNTKMFVGNEPKKREEQDIKFSPIAERIKRFNSAMELPQYPREEITTKRIDTKDSTQKPDIKIKSNLPNSESTPKIHFKKTFNYFKNLEQQSQDKLFKPKKISNVQKERINHHHKRGGSLNLPNISEKFFINNLYQDVYGNRTSFRGTPNKSALVEALATFSRNQRYVGDSTESEDDIKYDVFKKHFKSRKRRSIKSIFNIQY